MIKVNALGDACPIPVVKTKNAIKELKGPGLVETLVDNEIAVQNLTKMADQKGYTVKSEKISEGQYRVLMEIGKEEAACDEAGEPDSAVMDSVMTDAAVRSGTVVVISSDKMGRGDDELGKALMKGFIFALSQQDQLPSTILFYNGGARMTTRDSVVLQDLLSMEEEGVEILTCGTCLNHYGLTDSLAVGQVTNMYTIVEKMTLAGHIVKP